METNNKKIIAFEGIDGSGKSIQYQMLSQKLKSLGKKCIELSFPDYDGFFGKEIGAMLSGNNAVRADLVDAKSMALWYAIDRFKCFSQTDFSHADYILLNRYTLSNIVYQGIRSQSTDLHAFADWVFELEHNQLGLPEPDLYFIFDVDYEISKINVEKKGFREYTGNDPDVYERSKDLILTARKAYMDVATKYKNVHVIPCMQDGVQLLPEKINDTIMSLTLDSVSFK